MANGQVGATVTVALQRSALLGFLTGLVSTLTARQQGLSWEDAFIAGAVILLTTIISRGGLEGAYDGQRQSEGNVTKADVQPNT